MRTYKFEFQGTRVRSLNWWNGGNTKQARFWRRKLAKKERKAMWEFFRYNDIRKEIWEKEGESLKINVKIIRIYSTQREQIYDEDNFIGGCKHLRDGITDGLGFTNDNDPALSWEYEQIKTKEPLSRIEIIIKTEV
jgi:hypothetical protein